jgi:RNA polymerase sigma-70 factor, ECF subfamily
MATSADFEEFYAATVGRLLGQLFLVTGDLHVAEELVQEAFSRASVRWSQLRDYDVPEAWVRRVAMNLAADRARRLRRQARAILNLGPPPAVPAVSVETLALVEALRTLPVRQRQAIVLYYLADLPIQEIAQVLVQGTPAGPGPGRHRRPVPGQLLGRLVPRDGTATCQGPGARTGSRPSARLRPSRQPDRGLPDAVGARQQLLMPSHTNRSRYQGIWSWNHPERTISGSKAAASESLRAIDRTSAASSNVRPIESSRVYRVAWAWGAQPQ